MAKKRKGDNPHLDAPCKTEKEFFNLMVVCFRSLLLKRNKEETRNSQAKPRKKTFIPRKTAFGLSFDLASAQ